MKAILILLSILIIAVSLATGQCPNSTWIHRGNKCYFVKTEKADLYENIALCNQLNASLVSIVNEDENNEVSQIADNFWLGLAQTSKGSREFYWFDGSPFEYKNWASRLLFADYKYWVAYSLGGQWKYVSAFSRHCQMCSISLKPSISYKQTPNPADIKETLASKQCPNSTWIRHGNKCYFIKEEEADLYENIALCNQLNASLVSITSEAENIQVTRLVASLVSNNSFWLGLGHKSRNSKKFYWFDGSPFIYNSWYIEPEMTYKYFSACVTGGEWFNIPALKPNIQICSLDLNLNALPKKTLKPTELKESEGQCPNTNWRKVGSKCIYFDRTKKMPYWENRALCKKLNASMVSIHSDNENIQINRLFHYIEFWIGLKKTLKRNKLFKWEDGSIGTYGSWRIGQPRYLHSKYWAAYSFRGTGIALCNPCTDTLVVKFLY